MFAITLMLGLAACTHLASAPSPIDPSVERATLADLNAVCCRQAEEFPRPLVAIADLGAPVFGRITRLFESRPGYLSDKLDAQAHLRPQFRPLDMALITSDARLSNNLLPGAFSHVAIYLGTESELRRMGLWDHPSIVPHQAEIAGGGVFIEAVSPAVHLAPFDHVFNADRLVLLRSHLPSASARREAIAHFYSHIGTPFDYRFDGSTEDCLFCTELAEHVLQQLALESAPIYDRPVLLPDQIILTALNGSRRLTFVDYVEAYPLRWEVGSRADLIAKLHTRWRGDPGAARHPITAGLN
ncbi:MAG: hypothetical protein JJ908_09415 [Rhizobiales bacterium]|nr:hypothetical protein [Hyphomicrobiales bacterium]MBO6699038.1 hypothetical protein [Hyphomicrobiales bacterium]MBO6736576.1 hypothetical protein [Hyphomicrobiales bacterium]MBO6912350.1 hypothetical protein [Hyphomicrobiales bacterium]MBO6956288.1 hypothetical protein [Hyphomicrobiales bacterium]